MQALILGKKDFNQTLGFWIEQLDQYDFVQLTVKPFANSWSLGQVYMHLIQATHFFIKQIQVCTSRNDHIDKEAFVDAKAMFQNNEFPDLLLEGPPSNAFTPQPSSKEQLITGLTQLKDEIEMAKDQISKSQFKGKTKHFGLGYFTANEWMQFAEMHFRHHLRQKQRLDDYINRLHL